MAGPQVLDDLTAQVTSTVGVMESATVALNGVAARIAAAVAAAIANGATAEQLQPVTDEVNALKAASDALAQAVVSQPA